MHVSLRQYKLEKVLGSGAFGMVLFGRDRRGQPVAVKLEDDTKGESLRHEASIYLRLGRCKGVPTLHDYGVCGWCRFVVLDHLAKSIEEAWAGDASATSRAMVDALEAVHGLGVLHRDIKPENFRATAEGAVKLLDYGASCFYAPQGAHVPFDPDAGIVGSRRYASVVAIGGGTVSRRDDLESLVYTLEELREGSLPWTGAGDGALAIKKTWPVDHTHNPLAAACAAVRGVPFPAIPCYDTVRRAVECQSGGASE